AGGASYTGGNWANQDVTVTYTVTDERSGPAATYPLISGLPDGVTPVLTAGALSSTAAATLTAETSGVTLNASCFDNSANAATSLSFGPIKIDRTAPTGTGSAIAGGSPYPAGR